jgi:hypothetical protein
MPGLDVFKADGFSVTTLSLAIAEMDFQPSRIERLGLFRNESVTTTTVQVEKRRDTLAIVPSSARGGPGYAINQDLSVLRPFNVPHFQLNDSIMADEVQNIRAFGSQSELETVQNHVNRKMARGARILDATIEYQRMGAIQGIVYDVRPDNSTVALYNYYTEFNVTQDTVNFAFSNAGADILGAAIAVRKLIEDELGMDVLGEVHAFVGYDFFASLIGHAKVTTAYLNWYGGPRVNMDPLTMDLRYKGFEFGGIVWEVYRNAPNLASTLPTGEGVAFPVGVPDLFVSTFAPADYIETVNTEGLPRYARQYEAPNGKSVLVEMQTNHLAMNTRPKTSIKLTKS